MNDQQTQTVPNEVAAVRPEAKVRYQLRYQVLPGPRAEQDARVLAAFCTRHAVEEVALFVAAEEWNTGLLSREEEDRWLDMLRRVKPILEDAGLMVSVNPWPTTLHGDHGRSFPSDRPFRPTVSPLGEVSAACASFADPVWQDYIWTHYGRLAELGFRVLWIEDDFRYHNHLPLTWGGGFEPQMLERFARKIGRHVEREEVVRNILQPGEPHPWRELWMATWREAQLEAARGIAEAVRRHAPGASALGLMSSYPVNHSIEGRRWEDIFAALSIDGRIVHRPHYRGGNSAEGRNHPDSLLLLDRQRDLLPPGAEMAPEVENNPFTHWGKSDRETWAEMAECLFYGADALFLDLFTFSGNPADREPQIGTMLDRSRPALQWIAERFDREQVSCGVGLPWRQDAQARVHTTHGQSMDELKATELPAGRLMLRYGIPTSARTQRVNAVFGNLAWAFDDEQVRRLLAGGLLLDGQSAAILYQRGFGNDIGLRFGGWLGEHEHPYSVERVVDEAGGVEMGHCFSLYRAPRVAQLEPIGGAREWTTLLTARQERVGACTSVHENQRGGRVAMLWAAPDPAAHLMDSYQRQRLLHRAVDFVSRGQFAAPLVEGGAHLLPIHLRKGELNHLVVLNGSPDSARPRVRLPGQLTRPPLGTLLTPLAEPDVVDLHVEPRAEHTFVQSAVEVPYYGFLVVTWSDEPN